MSAERFYRLLLRAYPPDFRAEYGREMVLVFRDQCRDGDVRTLGFWVRVVWDVVCSAPALRAEATRTVEVIMKLAAILTVLLGAFGIMGAKNEWGGASQHAGTYVLAIVLGVAASLLLLGAGVGILLQKRQAARLALVASLRRRTPAWIPQNALDWTRSRSLRWCCSVPKARWICLAGLNR